MRKRKLPTPSPGFGIWALALLCPQEILVVCKFSNMRKNENAKECSFTMAAKTSTTLRVFPPVSFSFKDFYPVVFSEGKQQRGRKS